MILPAFVIGLLLSLTGLLGYTSAQPEHRSFTALIPALFGVVLLVCAVLAWKKSLRMHAMHAAATVALLGIVGTLAALIGRWDKAQWDAKISMIITVVLLVVFLVLCVRSFINARRQRQAQAQAQARVQAKDAATTA
jgi:uncharacterized membrane protein